MFDRFDDGGGIKTVETLISIGQRTLNHFDPAALPFGQLIQSKATLRILKGSPGDVHSKNGLELLLRQKKPK